MTGVTPAELEEKKLPDMCKHIWDWFLRLNAQRTSNGFGVNPISYQEIWCFSQLEQIEFEPWELELLRSFDTLAMNSFRKSQEKQSKSSKNKAQKN